MASALPESAEPFYQLLMEQSPVGIIVTDATGQITKLNPAAIALLGSPSEAASRQFNVLTLENARQAGVSRVYEIVLGENRAERMEGTYSSVWGKRSDVSLQVVPLRDGAGKVAGTLAMIEDVTAQRRAHAEKGALLEIADDLSGAFEIEAVLDRVHERAARVLACDRVATYSWDRERRAYRLARRFGVPDDLTTAAETLEFRGDEPGVADLIGERVLVINDAENSPMFAKDLRRFRVGAMVVAPLGARGRPLGALMAVREQPAIPFTDAEVKLCEGIARQVSVALETADLQAAQLREAAISAALARVGRELLVSLSDPALAERLCRLTVEVLECDYACTFLLREEDEAYAPVGSFGEAAGHGAADRLLRLPLDLGADAFRDEEVVALSSPLSDLPLAAVQRHLGLESCLYMALRRGGEVWGLHVAGYRDRDRGFDRVRERIAGGIAQLASFALENARLLRELERASRLKSDFVATMSHELRTPLNAIIGYCDLLLDGAYTKLLLDQETAVKRLQGRAHELFELITATLDVSRLEAGQLPVDLQSVDVNELLEEIRAEAYRFRPQPGVTLKWSLGENLPPLQTDAVKVKVILKNLLSNATKFTERGTISVSARRDGATVVLEVADTGIGIGAEEKRHIFDAFRQADSSNTRRFGGVGLGLYIVRRLLDLLGGTIDVDSQPGHGTTFRVALPGPGPGVGDRGSGVGGQT